MYRAKILFVILVAINIIGCASEPPRPGIPLWDYAREGNAALWIEGVVGKINGEVGNDNQELKKVWNFGGLLGKASGRMIQDQIQLAPTELNAVITKALTENTIPTITSVKTNNEKARLLSSSRQEWGISESHEGQITTDWMPIPGRIAGLLWWKKEYQTEVRHVITIKRSYLTAQFANFTILTEVRERPNSNYDWEEGDPELGRESFKMIKSMLLEAIKKELHTKSVKKK